MKKVFIDGSSGTTGLRIYERLESDADIELISLPENLRKDDAARHDAFATADLSFLCLPDQAAIEAVQLAKDTKTVIIDTSTAHRTNDSWCYGFPEIGGLRKKLAAAKYIANPGCHASGFIALIAPLVEKGLLPSDSMLSCFSLTGYSGGGKKMIAGYKDEDRSDLLDAPRIYGLFQAHKHIPEMAKVCGLTRLPCFSPVVADFYSGMEVTVNLFKDQIHGSINDIKEIYREYYNGSIIYFDDAADEDGFLSAGAFSGRDDMQICVFGNDERISLISRFDNLGKGASGAAIQNMNIIFGREETSGLCIGNNK